VPPLAPHWAALAGEILAPVALLLAAALAAPPAVQSLLLLLPVLVLVLPRSLKQSTAILDLSWWVLATLVCSIPVPPTHQ